MGTGVASASSGQGIEQIVCEEEGRVGLFVPGRPSMDRYRAVSS